MPIFSSFILISLLNTMHFLSKRRGYLLAGVSVVIYSIVFAYVPLSTTPMDTQVYMAYYEHPEWSSEFEPGYVAFMNLIRLTGIDYWQFRFVIALTGFLIISMGLIRFRIPIPNFLVLYAALPFISDVIQLRDFMMACFVFLSLSFLIEKTKKNILISVVIMLIAVSFQYLGFLFFIPICIRVFDDNPKLLERYVLIATGIIVLFALPPVRNVIGRFVIIPIVSLTGRGGRIAAYINRSSPGSIIIYDILMHYIMLLTVIKAEKFLKKNKWLSEYEENVVNVVQDVLISILGIVPLYFYAYNFDRVLKNSLAFFFVFIVLTMNKFRKYNAKSFFTFGILITSVCAVYFFGFYNYSTRWNEVVIPVLFQNTFLSSIR